MIRRIVLLCLALALPALGQTTLNGAGATFPNPMYQKWFSEYHKAHPDIQFNYQSIGSGGGIRQVLAQTVDFGASDGPMTDEQLSQAKTKILHIPTVMGAVVPAYNVPGVSGELKFTPEVLAGIFFGQLAQQGPVFAIEEQVRVTVALRLEVADSDNNLGGRACRRGRDDEQEQR